MAARGGGGGRPPTDAETEDKTQVPRVINVLKDVYSRVQKPLEKEFLFDQFHSPLLSPADFEAKPMVLLLGQYSVGKTTFIRYLLGKDFAGMRIGPEPTTERFSIIMQGPEDSSIPGNALAVHKDLPFTSLSSFGAGFLSRLEAVTSDAPVLKDVMLVDTPGVLSGEKQRIGRQYDFVEVVEWFAQRCDMILLLFDAHKLDISDEFKATIEALKGQDDKIRVVLNKADKITGQQLMRVYGAMMWSLGKVVKTPEVMRVYIGSFWDGPCMNKDFEAMFRAEQSDLLKDLRGLPRNATVRKLNELVKRARLARVHALVISHLRSQMPMMWGHKQKQDELLAAMPDQFFHVMKTYRLPRGDFPDLKRFVSRAAVFDFSKDFKKLNPKMIEDLDRALADVIPDLLTRLGHEKAAAEARIAAQELVLEGGIIKSIDESGTAPAASGGGGGGAGGGAAAYSGGAWGASVTDGSGHIVRGPSGSGAPSSGAGSGPAPGAPGAYGYGAGSGFPVASAPGPSPTPTAPSAPAASGAGGAGGAGGGFGGGAGGGGFNPFASAGTHDAWARNVRKEARDEVFFKMAGARELGHVSGAVMMPVMTGSGLGRDQLFKIWELSDIDKDGNLDDKEFAVCLTLLEQAAAGTPTPDTLPAELFPPTKRAGGIA